MTTLVSSKVYLEEVLQVFTVCGDSVYVPVIMWRRRIRQINDFDFHSFLSPIPRNNCGHL